jgi:hypothetical protein
LSKERKEVNAILEVRAETNPQNPHNPQIGCCMALTFPRVLPAPWYRDPSETVVVTVSDVVTAQVVEISAPCRPGRDRYYTMARRVRIRQSMRGAQ